MSIEDHSENEGFESPSEVGYENPSAGIEDLLAEEEEEFAGPAKSVKLRTGIGASRASKPRDEAGVDPNAVRWLFNPYEVIDLRNEGAGCGFDYLPNVIFQEVKSIPTIIRRPDPFNIASDPTPDGRAHNSENYQKFTRTAHMIMLELVAKNGDKGVIDVSELTGQDGEKAEALNQLLFGEEIHCVLDIHNPDHPVPVLPTLLESLEVNVRSALPGLDAGTRATVLSVVRKVRESITLAIRNARARINEAQKRLNDEKSPNRTLSGAEERCYLALGEEIPNQMPFLTRSAASQINTGAPIDSEALGRGIAKGLAAAASSSPKATAAIPVSKSTGIVENENPDFDVTDEDIDSAEASTLQTDAPQTGARRPGGKAKNS